MYLYFCRCLSLPGCAISDDVLLILAPALVRIEMIHLGRNPITSQGWEFFKNCFTDESSVGGEAKLQHLSINLLTESGNTASGSVKYIHPVGMEHLSHVLPYLEEVDLSGQSEVGPEGWAHLAAGLTTAHERGKAINLRLLKLEGCKIREETRMMLEDAVSKNQPSMRVDFGRLDEVDNGKKGVCCF